MKPINAIYREMKELLNVKAEGRPTYPSVVTDNKIHNSLTQRR
jgi:hypothetical protein